MPTHLATGDCNAVESAHPIAESCFQESQVEFWNCKCAYHLKRSHVRKKLFVAV